MNHLPARAQPGAAMAQARGRSSRFWQSAQPNFHGRRRTRSHQRLPHPRTNTPRTPAELGRQIQCVQQRKAAHQSGRSDVSAAPV
jgi:hypothetical protein